MGYEITNDCVGCPTYCIHCCSDYKQYYCDICKECEDESTHLYEWEGQEICFDCLKDKLTSKIIDDMDDSLCENGCETDILYQFNGEWLCNDCLYEILERDYRLKIYE
jgi:hypothetical protein